MPYFDFLCTFCKHLFEKRLTNSEYDALTPLTIVTGEGEKQVNATVKTAACPECGAVAKRVFSAPASFNMQYPGGQRH